MEPLGPFEPGPKLAVAVSGGADSMALTLLADAWARERGGTVLGLIVDHGLREAAAREAEATRARLAERGIATRVLRIATLRPGTALAARARAARFAVLRAACVEADILHLLLGHHAADQAETVIMRALSGSGAFGLAGMAALAEEAGLRLVRPLLDVPPSVLRASLVAVGCEWIEDPSNADPAALRSRLRAGRADRAGCGPATRALAEAAEAAGRHRAGEEAELAAFLAAHVTFHPEGFAVIPNTAMPARVLARVIAVIGGGATPGQDAVASLAAAPRPATLGGVRFLSGGRFAPGLLAVREQSAVAEAVPARPGAVWDGRFRLANSARPPAGAMVGALGAAAARMRRLTTLPSVVLRVLPVVFTADDPLAVPHLGWPDATTCATLPLWFSPPQPAAGAAFFAERKGVRN